LAVTKQLGFSVSAEFGCLAIALPFAHQCLEPEHLKPLLKIDAQANLNQINRQLAIS